MVLLVKSSYNLSRLHTAISTHDFCWFWHCHNHIPVHILENVPSVLDEAIKNNLFVLCTVLQSTESRDDYKSLQTQSFIQKYAVVALPLRYHTDKVCRMCYYIMCLGVLVEAQCRVMF